MLIACKYTPLREQKKEERERLHTQPEAQHGGVPRGGGRRASERARGNEAR